MPMKDVTSGLWSQVYSACEVADQAGNGYKEERGGSASHPPLWRGEEKRGSRAEGHEGG